MIVTRKAMKRAVDAERARYDDLAAVVDVAFLPSVCRVIKEMREGWAVPFSYVAADAGVPDKWTREIIRALAALGLAEHHPFCSEDDNLIRGSGYSLTANGARVQAMLRARSGEEQ
ncbi:hypothetical protein [Stakelama pacifica]|uniref:hypothetical protein n=1 Tax=Stakelama pacifica TaxID=517720 RepID=UPI00105F311D|nr:hypothetical protein [Stakelama pacifica]GGO96427.1 hypothetical protein GCM10011329_22930 [Stakelama pacifica]